MWIMPSIRPHLVARVFSVAPPQSRGIVVVEVPDAASYAGIKLPRDWSLHVVAGCPYFRDKVNRVFAEFPDESFYGIVGDDMVPETPGWDVILGDRAGRAMIAGAHQVHVKSGRIGAGAIGGDLVRAMGWLCLPTVTHFYSDAVLELIGHSFKCLTVYDDVRIAHHHFTVGLAENDESYRRRGSSSEDGKAFERWKQSEWPAMRERLSSLYK